MADLTELQSVLEAVIDETEQGHADGVTNGINRALELVEAAHVDDAEEAWEEFSLGLWAAVSTATYGTEDPDDEIVRFLAETMPRLAEQFGGVIESASLMEQAYVSSMAQLHAQNPALVEDDEATISAWFRVVAGEDEPVEVEEQFLFGWLGFTLYRLAMAYDDGRPTDFALAADVEAFRDFAKSNDDAIGLFTTCCGFLIGAYTEADIDAAAVLMHQVLEDCEPHLMSEEVRHECAAALQWVCVADETRRPEWMAKLDWLAGLYPDDAHLAQMIEETQTECELADAAKSGAAQRTASDGYDYEQFVQEVIRQLEAAQQRNVNDWLGHYDDWSYDDQSALGKLVFTRSRDASTATCDFQAIGTLNVEKETWLWSWANESIDPALTKHSQLIRAFGQEHGIDHLMAVGFGGAQESDGWELTAIAFRLAEAACGYSVPLDDEGNLLLFMTLSEPVITEV